jgi:hypothetical protein
VILRLTVTSGLFPPSKVPIGVVIVRSLGTIDYEGFEVEVLVHLLCSPHQNEMTFQNKIKKPTSESYGFFIAM